MLGDNYRERARLRGYLFEAIIAHLLTCNGFAEITRPVDDRIRILRYGFVEFRGRGGWHQIDAPFDYATHIPFINPIRILAEVKFFKGKIQKNLIREYIGVIKDIQENYFSDINLLRQNPVRYTELGVFFSASGFSNESEVLAFAHNIKTISYENVELVSVILSYLLSLEENYFRTSVCISEGNQSDFIGMFKQIINGNNDILHEFIARFDIPDGIDRVFEELNSSIDRIQTNFFANTSGGALIHFISNATFPDELFADTDTQPVRIHFETENRQRRFWMSFPNDNQNRRFYFKPPESLSYAAFVGGDAVLDEKQRLFKTLHISKTINNISRNLLLKLDNDWLDLHR